MSVAAVAAAPVQDGHTPVAPAVAADIGLELMVMTEVSTARAKAGDVVKLRLNRPVVIDGVIRIPAGTPAFGEVVDTRKSGMAMKRGKLAIRLVRIAATGCDLPLEGDLTTEGRGGKSDDAVKVLLAPFYAPFAPGNSAKFKAGDIVTGRLTQGAVCPLEEASHRPAA